MKAEFVEGPKALETFERGMIALFQVPKVEVKKPKPVRKQVKTSKG